MTMTTSPSISRLDYLNGKASHEEYYNQFVTPGILQRVKRFSPKALEDGITQDFNNIPLPLWEQLMPIVPAEVHNKLKACGDYPTKAGVVCILKEAARQLLQTLKNTQKTT